MKHHINKIILFTFSIMICTSETTLAGRNKSASSSHSKNRPTLKSPVLSKPLLLEKSSQTPQNNQPTITQKTPINESGPKKSAQEPQKNDTSSTSTSRSTQSSYTTYDPIYIPIYSHTNTPEVTPRHIQTAVKTPQIQESMFLTDRNLVIASITTSITCATIAIFAGTILYKYTQSKASQEIVKNKTYIDYLQSITAYIFKHFQS